MSYENHKYNNCVIEVLDLEHGKKVIEWWKSQGVDTGFFNGRHNKAYNDIYRFYGLIGGEFDNASYDFCINHNIDIITLPDENTFNNSSNIKTKQNGKGIAVQKVTPTIQSGIRISGSPTSGRRSKTSTSIGHLSNQKIVGY